MIKRISKKYRFIINHITYLMIGGESYARKSGVTIGKNCRIYTKKFGSEPFLITIGSNVTVTTGVQFITHEGSGWLFIDSKGRRYRYEPINIGNNVFIGANSIIMPGIKIEDRVIVAAGSVVTKSIPTNSIVAGVPARIIGEYNEYERRALASWASDTEIDNTLSYKDKVLSISGKSFRPFLTT